MAARITFAFLAICLLQFAGSAPAVATVGNTLDEFQKTVNDFLGNLKTHINVKDNDEIKKVSVISDNNKQQGLDEQVKQSLDKALNYLDEAIDNLKMKNPELQRKADELTIVKNTEGLDTVVADDLKKVFANVFAELQAENTRLHEASKKE